MIKQLAPALRAILGNTGWLMADRVVRLGFGLSVGIWVARYLGPTQFGRLNFAMSYIGLFATISTLGLDNIVVRNIVRDISSSPEILGTTFLLRLTGSVLAPLIAVATIHLVYPNDDSFALVELLSIGMIFQAFDTIDLYFQSQVQAKFTVLAKNVAFMLAALLRISLIWFGAPLWTFAGAQVVEFALGAIGLTLIYRYTGGRPSLWRARRLVAVQLLKQSWFVLLSGMAIVIYMRIDMVMLKGMQGDTAVGIYATATRVSEVWYFVALAIVSSVTPAIMKAVDNPIVYNQRMAKLFAVMSLIALVAGSAIALNSAKIIQVLFSHAYSAAGPVLAIHIWASLFVFLGVAQTPWDVSQNLMKLAFYRALAGAVANILLNLILIPRFSALGAAMATVISYAISAVLANAFDARTRPIFFLQLKSLFLHRLLEPHTQLT